MSPGLFRKGGRTTEKTFRRQYRSSRNAFRVTISCKSCKTRSSLGCKRKRKVPDLVGEESPGIGHFKAANFLPDCSSKGALLVSEQFTLEKTVESVGATRSTSVSTTLRLGLLPIIPWNAVSPSVSSSPRALLTSSLETTSTPPCREPNVCPLQGAMKSSRAGCGKSSGRHRPPSKMTMKCAALAHHRTCHCDCSRRTKKEHLYRRDSLPSNSLCSRKFSGAQYDCARIRSVGLATNVCH